MNTYARNEVLGRYRVLRRLGAGGMATVYLARDEKLGREVAVKRLHADSPEEMARRLEREARVGASLNHPNMVTVYDTGADAEGVVVVMEYVEGETLAATLRRGPLELERAITVIRDVAAALDHAHSEGVIHRDVKPANVLMRRDGAVKLVDLGIAQAAAETRVTRTGSVLGTAAYMAPEQLSGDGVCAESDVYALAAVAFEALSGRRPREGKTPLEVAHKVVSEPAPDLRTAWPQAPGAAAEVLARGLAREPRDRPDTAGELASDLAAALEEADTVAVPPPTEPMAPPPPPAPPSREFTPARSGRGVPAWLPLALVGLALAAVVVVLLAGGGSGEPAPSERSAEAPSGGGGAGGGGSDEAAAQAEPAPEASAAEGVPAPSSSPDPAEGATLNEQGKSLIDSGQPEEAVPLLEQAVSSFPEGTDDVNYAYALFNLGNAYRLAGRPDDAIPVLEARAEIPNQTDVVKDELKLAKEDAKD